MMSDLTARIEEALKNPGDEPWFPELTTELVEAEWQNLSRKAGLSPNTYGTGRAMKHDAHATRRIVARVLMFSGTNCPERTLQVETLEEELARPYEDAGIRFYTAEELNAANVLAQLSEAIDILKTVPTLFATAAALVKSIHVIDAGDDDYDVSFSEPHIPFSIFVSVPQSSVTSALRVSEAIVHEAMHLQLTLIEQIVPLVLPSNKKYFSPWRSEYRSPQGVLQALYVFRVTYKLMELLMLSSTFIGRRAEYISERSNQIAMEIEQLQSFQDCPDLTPYGFKFVRSLQAYY